jgi:hypothetical protein
MDKNQDQNIPDPQHWPREEPRGYGGNASYLSWMLLLLAAWHMVAAVSQTSCLSPLLRANSTLFTDCWSMRTRRGSRPRNTLCKKITVKMSVMQNNQHGHFKSLTFIIETFLTEMR